MKTYGIVDVYIHIFLTSALVGGEWWTSRPCRCTPGIHNETDKSFINYRKMLQYFYFQSKSRTAGAYLHDIKSTSFMVINFSNRSPAARYWSLARTNLIQSIILYHISLMSRIIYIIHPPTPVTRGKR
jgi:hypothetical protein